MSEQGPLHRHPEWAWPCECCRAPIAFIVVEEHAYYCARCWILRAMSFRESFRICKWHKGRPVFGARWLLPDAHPEAPQ